MFPMFAAGADDLAAARKANVLLVSTARSSEWKDHFERHFARYATTFQFQRFAKGDYEPLILRLKSFVPAPAFIKLPDEAKIEKLARSKSQLFIALREATESRNFTEIIVSEYASLRSDDVRELFLIIGLATLARVGIDPAVAEEAYGRRPRKVSFDEALSLLEGMAATGPSGRLIARHEFYVRNVLDEVVSIDITFKLMADLLASFTKYRIPVTKHVTRQDAALFRFLLNHSFVRERAEKGGDKFRGLKLYKLFDIAFQLDGHFWLQYGLYYQRLGDSESAISMLEKSVEAFPDNPFAVHALASERLLQAKRRSKYDEKTRDLIDSAVIASERLQANQYLTFDQYPLVTLSRYHIPALLRHDQKVRAAEVAKDYYERLRLMERKTPTPEIGDAKARLLMFLTTGIWDQQKMR